MKKKFLSLMIGALTLASIVNAQQFGPGPGQVLFNGVAIVPPPPSTNNGTTITASTPLSYTTIFTFNGIQWGITPVPVPNINPVISGLGNSLTGFLNQYFLVPTSSIPGSALAQLNPAFFITISGVQYAQLANAIGTLGVTPVPFDLNLMMILGIGAMGAVYAARRRRQGMLMA